MPPCYRSVSHAHLVALARAKWVVCDDPQKMTSGLGSTCLKYPDLVDNEIIFCEFACVCVVHLSVSVCVVVVIIVEGGVGCWYLCLY